MHSAKSHQTLQVAIHLDPTNAQQNSTDIDKKFKPHLSDFLEIFSKSAPISSRPRSCRCSSWEVAAVVCMSQTRVAVTALGAVTVGTAVGIAYIHREQTEEKQRLHEGVIRDQELLRRKELKFTGKNAGEHATK